MDFDPYQFGQLTAQVERLEYDVAELKGDMKTLLALAERHRGGLWAGMSVASVFGAVVAFVAEHWINK